MKKTIVRFVYLFTAVFLLIPMLCPLFPVAKAAESDDGLTARINALRSIYPDGWYWNHLVTENRFNGDNLKAVGNAGNRAFGEQFADSVSQTLCYTHNGTCPVGHYDCNYFDGGRQCWGFAMKVFYDTFGVRCSSLQKDIDVSHVRAGSYARFGGDGPTGHSVFVTKREGNIITVVECNYAGNCRIKWDRKIDLTNPEKAFSYCFNVPDSQRNDNSPVVFGVKCTLTPECAPNMRLDVCGGAEDDEVNIQIYEANNTPAQEVMFENMGNGYVRIITASGKAVDVKHNNAVSEETVWQYGCNGTDAQLWRAVDAGDGYIYLIPKSNQDLRLDVKGRGTTNCTDVQLYWANQTPAQRWRVRICY